MVFGKQKVIALPKGENFIEKADVAATIEISNAGTIWQSKIPKKPSPNSKELKTNFIKRLPKISFAEVLTETKNRSIYFICESRVEM
jgi:hypothetical protein